MADWWQGQVTARTILGIRDAIINCARSRDGLLTRNLFPDMGSKPHDDQFGQHVVSNVLKSLQDGRILAWADGLYQASQEKHDAFKGVMPRAEIVSHRNEAWFGRLEDVEDVDRYGRTMELFKVFSWFSAGVGMVNEDHLQVISVRMPLDAIVELGSSPAPARSHEWMMQHTPSLYFETAFGPAIPLNLPGETQIYAAMEWLALPIADKGPLSPRAERRRLEREYEKRHIKLPQISTVYLRPYAQSAPSDSKRAGTQRRGSDFQYAVRGHWRRYAKRNEGRPVFIMPYMKGNKEGPVRAPKTLYKVRE